VVGGDHVGVVILLGHTLGWWCHTLGEPLSGVGAVGVAVAPKALGDISTEPHDVLGAPVDGSEPLVVLDSQCNPQGGGPPVVPWVGADPHGHRVVAVRLLVAPLAFQGERGVCVPPWRAVVVVGCIEHLANLQQDFNNVLIAVPLGTLSDVPRKYEYVHIAY